MTLPVNISWLCWPIVALATRATSWRSRLRDFGRRRAESRRSFPCLPGAPSPGDIQQLAQRYRCDVVVSRADGAWAARSLRQRSYRLVENPARMEDYRRRIAQQE